MLRHSLALLMVGSGCATSQHLVHASVAGKCAPEQMTEIAYQAPLREWAAEDTPELRWYQGCERTVVCDAAGACFPASAPGLEDDHVVVDQGRVRHRREFQLPGLTHAETAWRDYLASELNKVKDAQDPGDSNCSSGLGGLGGAGNLGPGIVLFLPIIAIVGIGLAACAGEHAADARAYRNHQTLAQELAQVEARIRPAGSDGCTREEVHELDRVRLYTRSVGGICAPRVVKRAAPPPAVAADDELSRPPLMAVPTEGPSCTTGLACRERARTSDDADEARQLFVRACELGDAQACEEGASLAARCGHLQLAAMMRAHREVLLKRDPDAPLPAPEWASVR
jgi:hypothetical protein